MSEPIRLGRIGYLNVLPIYHPLERGGCLDCEPVPGGFSIVSGPPSALNRLMARGELDISAASSIEYARNPDRYLLVPDLAIGSRGPVQSVLLLSRAPVAELSGRSVLVSSQTHTSAALLRVLLARDLGVEARFLSGDATALLAAGERPDAILAIGDEALELRHHADYPVALDLGEAWRNWTGLPFIFGVWLVSKEAWELDPDRLERACRALASAKRWGVERLDELCTLASASSSLDDAEMCSYFGGLVYDLGPEERRGLELFFRHLASAGIIEAAPELRFVPLDDQPRPASSRST